MSADESRSPPACRRHALKTPLLGAVGWFAAAVGALCVAAIPYDAGEDFCGLWGCYPPLPPLAAMHLFWLVACGAIVWDVWTWRPATLTTVGTVALVAAVGGTAVVVGRDLFRWLDAVPADYRHFWPRRAVYTVATLSDVPLLQGLVAGLACLVLGRAGRVRPSRGGPPAFAREGDGV